MGDLVKIPNKVGGQDPQNSLNSNRKRVKNARASVCHIMKEIRSKTPQTIVDPKRAKGSEIWGANFAGQPTKRVIIYLRSSGCAWAIKLRQDGKKQFKPGCLDCEHSVAETTMGAPISSENYYKQFRREFEKYNFADFPILCLYNEGNLLNENELPLSSLKKMLTDISNNASIKSLIVESLPEYINERTLSLLTEHIPSCNIEIGIGLESIDQTVRDLCINKPFTLGEFQRSVDLVHRAGHKVLTYVLLKPSFLSEAEAVQDSIQTIKEAFRLGADVVSIEPVNVGSHNMAGLLNRLGKYRNPWLWSVLEVLRNTHGLGEIRVGGQQFAPQYSWTARNCPNCNPTFSKAFHEYNLTYDISLFEGIRCSCKADWLVDMEMPSSPLIERVENTIPFLNQIFE